MQRGQDPVEEPNTEKELKCVDGTLELKGTYQVHGNEVYRGIKFHFFSGCQKVIAEDAKLELFAPLVFNSTSLEFEGHLTVVAKAPMAGSCLRVSGQVVVSGDFFVKDCQNQLPDTDRYANGGGIYALNIIQKSGKISIENSSSKKRGGAIYVKDSFIQEGGDMMIEHCRADKSGGAIYSKNNFRQDGGHLTIQNCTAVSSDGGAIYVEDSFTQEGGEMMLKHCQAGGDGGGVYAKKNFTQNNGVLQVEECSAGWTGGALRAERSFRQTGGNISLSNCRAREDGGGLLARDFEQLAGAMRIQSCKAGDLGGGLRIIREIFRQDGELHVRTCSARDGGVYLRSDKVEQGESAIALVEARQFRRAMSFTNKWATHTHTHT